MDPVIAIVGRPNVGKSSLLNALLKRRYAGVHLEIDRRGPIRRPVSATQHLASPVRIAVLSDGELSAALASHGQALGVDEQDVSALMNALGYLAEELPKQRMRSGAERYLR